MQRKQAADEQEQSPEDPLIGGFKPGKQIKLRLDE